MSELPHTETSGGPPLIRIGGRTPAYHADGHRLTILIERHSIGVHIECPGEGRCEGLREFAPGAKVCIVQYNARELGFEFVECQEGEERSSDTPCEIEWREWGTAGSYFEDPEYEFWWRPV